MKVEKTGWFELDCVTYNENLIYATREAWFSSNPHHSDASSILELFRNFSNKRIKITIEDIPEDE